MTLAAMLLAIAFVPMVAEAVRSRTNERALRAAGATEPARDVYGVMQLVYPLCFLAMIAEAWMRGRTVSGPPFVPGLLLFLAAKALKYWAIATLGARWTFRVLVPPASTRIVAGPYRMVRHPNYIAVAGELAGMALMAQAQVAGVAALAAFGALMVARIRIEERALAAARDSAGPVRRETRGL